MEGYTYHDLGEQEFTRIAIVEPGEPANKLQCSLRTLCRRVFHSPSTEHDSILATKRPATAGTSYNQRLLEFFEKTEHEPETPPSENFAYDALSYVWGSLQPEVPITCDGKSCLISRSLDQALRSLRQKEKPLYMWIDAMCINQKNVLERNEQVARMKQIYQCAEKVCIWLGDNDEETYLVLRLLEAHRKKAHEPWFSVRTEFGPHAPEWAAMIRWLNRPWFWRVWTIQEARVARNAVVCFGPYSTSLSVVDSVLSLHVSRDVNHDLAGHLEEAFRLPGLSVRLNESNTWNWDSNKLLLDVLLSARRHQATDPRDKVYGILGLVPNLSDQDLQNPLIKPDYTKTKESVYKNAAIFSMMQSRSLRTIQAVYHGAQFRRHETASSWVPQWDQKDGPILLGERSGSPLRYSDISESQISIFDHETISQGLLSVSGNIEATVRVVLSNISQEELGRDGDRGRTTVFDRLWAELRCEIGSPIYIEKSHLIVEFIEALTIGINGRGESGRLYDEFIRTVHWMWGHVPVKIKSGESSPFSNSGSADEMLKEEEEEEEKEVLEWISEDNESEASLSDSTGRLQQYPGLVPVIINRIHDGTDQNNSSIIRGSDFGDHDDEERCSSQHAAAEFFRFNPGICDLCKNPEEQLSDSLHSYLMSDPNREELPGLEKGPHTFEYWINDFFENSWNYGAADGRFGGTSLDFLAPCIDVCNLRRFFVTDDKLFGIGPQAMRAGDIITSLQGATFPCVLRKAEISLAELGIQVETTGNLYHLIGECYIQKGRDSSMEEEKSPETVKFHII